MAKTLTLEIELVTNTECAFNHPDHFLKAPLSYFRSKFNHEPSVGDTVIFEVEGKNFKVISVNGKI